MWMNGMAWAMMALMGLFTLALLAIVIAGVIWLARSISSANRSAPVGNGEDVLRRRYAAGEIGDDEYRQRLATLHGHPTEPGPAGTTDCKGNPQP